MKLNSLVVSDPPHADIDEQKAADLLGLTATDLRLKANYPAPEVWLAYPDLDEAIDAAAALQGTGLEVAILDATSLAGVPGPAPLTSFTFGDRSFVARIENDEIELPYDAPALGVFCKPPGGIGPSTDRPARSSWGRPSMLVLVDGMTATGRERGQSWAADAHELRTTFDLYAASGGEEYRFSIAQGFSSFAGLGKLMGPATNTNMATCVSECRRRFSRFTLDARLSGIRPRRRTGGTGVERWDRDRRLFSFGTATLDELLVSIAPELGDVSQYELGSRLAYLLHR